MSLTAASVSFFLAASRSAALSSSCSELTARGLLGPLLLLLLVLLLLLSVLLVVLQPLLLKQLLLLLPLGDNVRLSVDKLK